jgi:hypothetical protein
MKKLLLAFASVLLVVVSLGGSQAPAQAHAASNFFHSPYVWNNNTTINVYVQETNSVDQDFWGPKAVDSLQAAISAWQGINNAVPLFSYAGVTTDTTPCSGSPTRVVIKLSPFTSTDLGQADGHTFDNSWPCVSISIQPAGSFPQGESWQKDCSDTGPNEHSLCGVLTHELGHATGFGSDAADNSHFTDNNACPSNDWSNFSTMCSGWSLTHEFLMVNTEAHDKHTLANEYPH